MAHKTRRPTESQRRTRSGVVVASPEIRETAATDEASTTTVASVLTGLAAFAMYVATLHPSVPGGDAGELIVAAQSLSVAHPPGYPLYVMVGHLFSMLPFGSVAWRVNLLSAVCDAGAVSLLALTIGRLTHRSAAAIAGAGLFAFSPTVWTYATGAEVFPLNNLLVAAIVFCAVRAWERGRVADVYLLALVVGVATSHHHTSMAVGGIALLAVLWHTRREWHSPARVAALAGSFAVGLLPYLFLPLGRTSMAQWGDQSTWSGFVAQVLRRDYGTFQLASSPDAVKLDTLSQLAVYVSDAWRQLIGAGVLLGAWGLVAGWREPRWRPVALTLAFTAAAFLVVFHSMANLPLDQPLFFGIVTRFWQQPNLLVCVLAGLGFAAAVGRLPRVAGLGLALALVLVQAGLHRSPNNQRGNWIVHDYGTSLLSPLSPRTLVLTRGDLGLNSARYLQMGEGVRTDVRILDQEMLTYRWMTGRVRHLLPDVLLPGTHYHPQESGGYSLRQLVDANIGTHPVVLCGGVKPGDTSLSGAYDLWPIGLCEEVRPHAAPPDVRQWLARAEAALPTFRSGASTTPATDSWERVAWTDYWEARSRVGLTLLTAAMAQGDDVDLLSRTVSLYGSLTRQCPTPQPHFFKNLGIAAGRLASKRPEFAATAVAAFRRFQTMAIADPDLPAITTAIKDLERLIPQR
jgi:hypothetical protein